MRDTTYHSKDIWRAYAEEVEDPIPWETWKVLMKEFNTRVMERVIYHGERFNMGHMLSEISVIRIKSSPNSKYVDWKASNELKQEIIDEGGTPRSEENPDGEDWLVYHDDPWIAKFYWSKRRGCRVPYKSAYCFQATGGAKGNKTKLKELCKADDLRCTNFRLVEPHFRTDKEKEAA